MSPVWQAAVFVGAQVVVGLLAYWQGRKDEALHWQAWAVRVLSRASEIRDAKGGPS